jgi:hypothetical protein
MSFPFSPPDSANCYPWAATIRFQNIIFCKTIKKSIVFNCDIKQLKQVKMQERSAVSWTRQQLSQGYPRIETMLALLGLFRSQKLLQNLIVKSILKIKSSPHLRKGNITGKLKDLITENRLKGEEELISTNYKV